MRSLSSMLLTSKEFLMDGSVLNSADLGKEKERYCIVIIQVYVFGAVLHRNVLTYHLR